MLHPDPVNVDVVNHPPTSAVSNVDRVGVVVPVNNVKKPVVRRLGPVVQLVAVVFVCVTVGVVFGMMVK